jgi:hypothetical protein
MRITATFAHEAANDGQGKGYRPRAFGTGTFVLGYPTRESVVLSRGDAQRRLAEVLGFVEVMRRAGERTRTDDLLITKPLLVEN